MRSSPSGAGERKHDALTPAPDREEIPTLAAARHADGSGGYVRVGAGLFERRPVALDGGRAADALELQLPAIDLPAGKRAGGLSAVARGSPPEFKGLTTAWRFKDEDSGTEKLERARIRKGRLASDASFGFTGMFEIDGPCG